MATRTRFDRERLEKKYEAMAYEAQRQGDAVTAQTYFQAAKNYKRSKDHEQ